MGQFAINGHRSKVPLSTWGVLELHQNSFLGSSWDLYGAIKRTGPPRSGKFSLNRHSIGLRKVLSSRPEPGSNVQYMLFNIIMWPCFFDSDTFDIIKLKSRPKTLALR